MEDGEGCGVLARFGVSLVLGGDVAAARRRFEVGGVDVKFVLRLLFTCTLVGALLSSLGRWLNDTVSFAG